jgi:D-arabinose 1-dehydrogenase-like Zn-dependent alcohol dehydrogenase
MKAVVFGKFRSAITVVLMLWCAGAGCMMVSYAHGAAMTAANTAKDSSGSTGSMGTHTCCKARHASERRPALSTKHVSSSDLLANLEELAESPNSSNAMNCCPLNSGTFVVNGRQRISEDDASESSGVKAVSILTSFAAAPFAMPLRLPNQKQTYLRGCVFLI